jgi:fructose-bisphosphate aldolase class I
MRRAYRDMLFTAPKLGDYISGIILFEETLKQNALNGKPFPELLKQNGMVPGIKVDKGLINIPFTAEEKVTQGLDGLAERFVEYKKLGARFAKWRATYAITDQLPSMLAVHMNANILARYAAICQEQDIVPIVEPEILIDGQHTIERCYEVSEVVLHALFDALFNHHVQLEHIILKPSMVISGKECAKKANFEQVAQATVKVLRRTVPGAVPTINFLSGGQSDVQATKHLQLMNQDARLPWNVSFSYSRALQNASMQVWQGKDENIKAAQAALLHRAKLNSAASLGKYTDSMENA